MLKNKKMCELPMVCVTEDFLNSIQDSKGLTAGQFSVLAGFAKSNIATDWMGMKISKQVADFLLNCKGYRKGKYEAQVENSKDQ